MIALINVHADITCFEKEQVHPVDPVIRIKFNGWKKILFMHRESY